MITRRADLALLACSADALRAGCLSRSVMPQPRGNLRAAFLADSRRREIRRSYHPLSTGRGQKSYIIEVVGCGVAFLDSTTMVGSTCSF